MIMATSVTSFGWLASLLPLFPNFALFFCVRGCVGVWVCKGKQVCIRALVREHAHTHTFAHVCVYMCECTQLCGCVCMRDLLPLGPGRCGVIGCSTVLVWV